MCAEMGWDGGHTHGASVALCRITRRAGRGRSRRTELSEAYLTQAVGSTAVSDAVIDTLYEGAFSRGRKEYAHVMFHYTVSVCVCVGV